MRINPNRLINAFDDPHWLVTRKFFVSRIHLCVCLKPSNRWRRSELPQTAAFLCKSLSYLPRLPEASLWNPGAHRSQGENYCPKESQKWMVFCWLFDCFNNTYKFFFKAIFHSYKTEFQAKYTSCNPTHLSHHNQETICPVVQGQNLRENLKFLMAEMSRWCSNFPCLWLSTLCSLISLFPRTSWGLIFFLIGAVSLAPLIIQSPLNSVTSLLSLFKSYASFKS